jgi:MFS transporter
VSPVTSSYARILSRPGALQFSAAGFLARFPMSMVGISTILTVQSLYGNYTSAGGVSAALVVATAVGAPVLARLVDARGQSRVMLPAVLGSALGMVGMITAAGLRAPLWVLVALALVAGGLGGSMGSLVRSRWTTVLDSPDDIHTAFSLEAALDEVVFVVGPVAATALCTSAALPVTSGWVAALCLHLGGGLWLLSQRATEPPAHGPGPASALSRSGRSRDRANGPARTATSALRHGAVLAVVAVFLGSGALFGANDVTAVAFATEQGRPSSSGLVLAAWALGSLSAALVYGSRTWAWPMWRQFLVGVLALALGASTFILAGSVPVLMVLMLVTGMSIAPTVTVGNHIVQAVTPRDQLTEGLTWVGTAMNVGVSLGSLLAGRLVDTHGSRGGYVLVTVFAWLSVLVALATIGVVRRARVHHHLPEA